LKRKKNNNNNNEMIRKRKEKNKVEQGRETGPNGPNPALK
jgi:hypothetical protein